MPAQVEACSRVTSEEDVQRVIAIISTSFHSTALANCFISEIDNTPPQYPSKSIDADRRNKHFAPGILDGAKSGSEVVQSGNWSAVAIWEPPNFQGTPFSEIGYCGPVRAGWRDAVQAAKQKHLKDRPFWHLAFLARNPDVPAVSGAIGAVIRPFLERAKQSSVPVWLEAVDERGVAIYEHYGFRMVEKITLATGQINAAGWPEAGGIGVSGYAMILEP